MAQEARQNVIGEGKERSRRLDRLAIITPTEEALIEELRSNLVDGKGTSQPRNRAAAAALIRLTPYIARARPAQLEWMYQAVTAAIDGLGCELVIQIPPEEDQAAIHVASMGFPKLRGTG